MSRYWFKNCPECNQGRLFVMKAVDNGFFLLCEECESAWKTPEDTNDLRKNFSVSGLRFAYASAVEIDVTGWSLKGMNEHSE